MSIDATAEVHPQAIVDPSATVGPGVRVGPFAVVGAEVELGEGCVLHPHAVVLGPSRLGARNSVHSFACVGGDPQDLKFKGERTVLEVGDDNVFREFVTVNRGTGKGGGKTRIGSHCLLMAYVHVAHDCWVGDHVIFANNATLAGHVVLEDFVGLGGLAAIGQFVRIGESAFLGAGAMVSMDVPPYCLAQGDRARLLGLNLVGLRRRGFSQEALDALDDAYRIAFREGETVDAACGRILDQPAPLPEVRRFADFLRASERGVTRPTR